MIELFMNDLRIYSETTESTEGLEIIKHCILENILNFETVCDDYIDNDNLNTYDGVVAEARNFVKVLNKLIDVYEIIKDCDCREIYKTLNNFHYEDVKFMLSYVVNQSMELLARKNKVSTRVFEEDGLTEDMLESWYIDLYNLFDKYEI